MSFYLFFDFETTGIGDIRNQRAIQLAWIVSDCNFNILSQNSYYIKGNKEINTNFHKNLTIEFIEKNGYELEFVLTEFDKDITSIFSNNGYFIAHNISFDSHILFNEIRACDYVSSISENDFNDKSICTMKKTVNICKLPSKSGGWKYPKLIELYRFLYGHEPDGVLHEASMDTNVLYNCYKRLTENGFWEN